MVRKKNALTMLLGLVMLSAMINSNAGGYDQYPTWESVPDSPQNVWTHYSGFFYLGVSGGYAWSDWSDLGFSSAYTDIFPTATTISANDGGDTWGLLLGYQFTPHFAVEIGGYDLFDGDRQIRTKDQSLVNQQLFNDDASSYIIYAAVKAMLPLSQKFDVFAKLGPLYRSIDHTNDCSVTNTSTDVTTNCSETPPVLSDSYDWSAFIAAGAEMYLIPQVPIAIQWYYVPGNGGSSDSDDAPSINALVGTISYALRPL